MQRKRLRKRPDTDSIPDSAYDPAGTQQCLICLEKLLPAILRGKLPCGHSQFCHDCIEEWSRASNKCPLCAAKFNELKLAAVDEEGKLLELTTTFVSDHVMGEDVSFPWDMVICQTCGSDGDEHILMLCDSCNEGYHTTCLGMDSIPNLETWYCDTCLPLLTSEQAEQQWIAMERVGRARRNKRYTRLQTVETPRRRLRHAEVIM